MNSFSPFQLPRSGLTRWLVPIVEKATGLSYLHRHYLQRPPATTVPDFLRFTLKTLGISYHSEGLALEQLPQSGPLLIVANHPLGGVEGVILSELLMQVRPDLKVMANHFLKRIPELNELFIGVDVFEGSDAIKANMKAIRQAGHHLKDGGALLIFPAGEVSVYDDDGERLQDKEWSRFVGRLARTSHADVLPVFIDGQNSSWFYRAGKIHPRLRTLLLGRELINKKDQSIGLRLGSLIGHNEIQKMASDQAITDYLRLNTYLLGEQPEQIAVTAPPRALDTQAIQSDIPADILQQAIQQLPESARLLEHKQFAVYIGNAPELGDLLTQIGIIRERNFRAVGEGTGKAIDLDKFDQHYHHLFIWDSEQRAIAGAYRLGVTKEIIQSQGMQGLYSRTLFDFDERFLDSMPNSIELGRSVIDANYQKSLAPLMLLWKGIAAFVSAHPNHQTLFGPVSISGEYRTLTHQLIVSCLTSHYYDVEKAQLVKATTPLSTSPRPFWSVGLLSGLGNLQLLSNLVARLENGKGLPVLIRQYLSLNGRFVCFNVDPDFNQTVDGLILVDLTQVPHKVLAKYMGNDAAKSYLTHHGQSSTQATEEK